MPDFTICFAKCSINLQQVLAEADELIGSEFYCTLFAKFLVRNINAKTPLSLFISVRCKIHISIYGQQRGTQRDDGSPLLREPFGDLEYDGTQNPITF